MVCFENLGFLPNPIIVIVINLESYLREYSLMGGQGKMRQLMELNKGIDEVLVLFLRQCQLRKWLEKTGLV